MCGIAGIVELEPGAPVDPSALRRMTAVLHHRGPDDSGIFTRGGAGLGHTRLSIIDLVSGDQPMLSDDGRIAVVFNGEVYNFRDLRRELEGGGCTFRTTSDTEVLLRAYERRGLDAFLGFNAQLACALWDDRTKTLVLARDRLGKKPLYYTRSADRFLFGSEIKALLASGYIDSRVNMSALSEYLSYGYIAGEQSILSGVHRLPPGHVLTLRNGRIEVSAYWKPDLTPQDPAPSEAEALETVERLMLSAVERRMIADVPLGAFLSGGLDSSLIVALMTEVSADRVRTFSVGFDESEYSELEDARLVADHLKTDHTEIIVKPRALDELDTLIWHFDEPFADSSMVPTYYVCRAARESVTVALSGDGGDELFGGYERYLGIDRYGRGPIPPFMRRALAAPLLALLPFSTPGWNRVYEFCHGDRDSLPPRLGLFPYIQSQLVTHDLQHEIAECAPFAAVDEAVREGAGFDPVRRYQLFDTVHYLPGDILTKVDRASMAVSLEVRSPLLDYELFDYASRLPTDMKLHRGVTKIMMRLLAERRLPAETLRRKKHGFTLPKKAWFKGELREYARDILLDSKSVARGYFRPRAVEQVLDQHAVGRRDYSEWIWSILVLELWHRSFIDGPIPGDRPVQAHTV